MNLKKLKKDLMLVQMQEYCQIHQMEQLKNAAGRKRDASGGTNTTKSASFCISKEARKEEATKPDSCPVSYVPRTPLRSITLIT